MFLRGLSFLLALAACYAAVVCGSDAHSVLNLFESHYRGAHSLEVTFLEQYAENGRVARVEAGTAYFRRPGKMRWEYQSPEKNLFLVDGKTAWFYVPADHTVTRVPARQSADWRTPLALLAGEMKTSRLCAHIELAGDETPASSDDIVLRCEFRGPKSEKSDGPKGAPQKEKSAGTAFFEISRTNGDLVRVLIPDPGGVQIEFHFKNWKINPPLEEAMFHFNPPPGVAIVNAESPQGNGGLNP